MNDERPPLEYDTAIEWGDGRISAIDHIWIDADDTVQITLANYGEIPPEPAPVPDPEYEQVSREELLARLDDPAASVVP